MFSNTLIFVGVFLNNDTLIFPISVKGLVYYTIPFTERLTIGKTYRVRLEAVGQYSMVFVNGVFNTMTALKNSTFVRDGGNVTAVLSDPWRPAAAAKISNIAMSSMMTLPPLSNQTLKVIYNSLFDDCSRVAGADAGCGHNLQCKG